MSSQKTQTNYQAVLQQEVTRKQFLQMLGLGMVSVLGFNNLLNMVLKLGKPASGSAQRADKASSFGGGKFGV